MRDEEEYKYMNLAPATKTEAVSLPYSEACGFFDGADSRIKEAENGCNIFKCETYTSNSSDVKPHSSHTNT
ncbi:hypothetical protein KIN20_027470 [Parelaphostrongylus tenuis]|uniref:Uncharacterized protein n=1 Tax=Parelaphostrongylus tenuis TaxID=148309 RepID=A0AAD5QZE3_PARTN|nr:hypothetical protein KIN20_027470 [Parelaphostrongylus tenuis]